MKHQLPNNCYTICKSHKQCKELFEWAKANGVKTYYDCNMGETILSYYNSDSFGLVAECKPVKQSLAKSMLFIPLPEFIARLKNEWVEGISVNLTKYQAETIVMVMEKQDAEVWLANNNYNERMAVQSVLNSIKEQLNQMQ